MSGVNSSRVCGFAAQCFALIALAVFWLDQAHAQTTVCSAVRIQIQQELTLERQAFDAHMRITNGLDLAALENIDINVWFKDSEGNTVLASSDPNNTSALFFISLVDMQGVSGGIQGSGRIEPASQGDIHWLIIPASGAGGQSTLGELYHVGATLSYTLAGESEVVEVDPDFIRVRPMPKLRLDYFLPEEVIGEDPLAPGQQEPIPFPLAVRVSNVGYGQASNLAIESAQPQIVDNSQGLLINFELLNTQVNDGPVVNSLLANFGDLNAGESATAIWQMMVSLYGHFISFEADYYHSDTLGGALTSLIDSVNTHTLVGVVRNDLPGRDDRRDFLVTTGNSLMLYESDGIDTPVANLSADSSLQLIDQGQGYQTYQWTFPATDGPVYAVLDDPTGGQGQMDSVWRSDGKSLLSENFWQMPTKPDQQWVQRVHIFDTNSTGSYQVMFLIEAEPEPPELLVTAPDLLVTGEDGTQSSFQIALSAQPASAVQVPVTSSDTSEGTVLPAVVSFDASNWNQPQTVTVTGVDDDWLDGDINYEILIGPSISADSAFDGLEHAALPAINLDNDTAGLVLSPVSGLATAGADSSAQFHIRLNARPLAPVQISLVSDAPEWGVPIVPTLVLDAENWNAGVPVLIEGQVDPSTLAGSHDYAIVAEVVSGGEPWLALGPADVTVVHRAGETWALTAGRVELPALAEDAEFVRVTFEHAFETTPVVVLIADDGEPAIASVRLGAVDTEGFTVVQVQPEPDFELSDALVVHYLAMEPGRRTLPGGARIEAGVMPLSVVQGGGSSDAWQTLSFNQPFNGTPAFFASIQSLANEQAALPQAPSNPWLTLAVREINHAQAELALERSGLGGGAIEQPEQVGWIALAGQNGEFESGAGLVNWQTIAQLPLSGEGACSEVPSWLEPDTNRVVLAGLIERPSLGGWLRLCTIEPSTPGVFLQQPGEQPDNEVDSGAVGNALMFTLPFHTRLPYLPDFLFRDRFSSGE